MFALIETPVVVLAGGRGARMGGDKPLRLWRGRRLVDRAVDLARGYSADVRIVVRGAEQMPHPPAPLMFDVGDIDGPLAGVATALSYGAARGACSVLTIPCDAPLLPVDLAVRLEAALVDCVGVAVPANGGEIRPDCALWRTSLLPALIHYASTGQSSLRSFARATGMSIVEWADAAPFANANTPEQLAALEI